MMQKGIIAALMLVSLPVTGTMPGVAAHDDDGYEIVYDERHVYLVRHAGGPDHEGTGTLETFRCGSEDATTYLVTGSQYCTTGRHTVNGGTLTMGFQLLQPDLSGTLSQVLLSDAGEVRFRCTWDEGRWTGCEILSAEWPSPGAPICHDVWGHRTAGEVLMHVPNLDTCEVLVEGVTTNSGSDGVGSVEGAWSAYLAHA